jgi:hypothetical protein
MSALQKLAVFVTLVGSLAASSTGSAVTIDFESIGQGIQPSNFLSAYGIPSIQFSGGPNGLGASITITNSTEIVPSGSHVLTQYALALDTNQVHRLTFNFSPLLSAFSLSRVGTNSGDGTDVWAAKFYDSSNVLLGSFGDSTPQINSPVTVYSFNALAGQSIARMDLESIYTGFPNESGSTSRRNIPVDNFVLTPVPEPISVYLAAIALVSLAISSRQSFCSRPNRIVASR